MIAGASSVLVADPAVVEAAAVDWWSAWRGLSPRPTRLRVDRRLDHAYLSEDWPLVEPEQPYAVYLAGWDGRFRLLAFDLDVRRGDVDESCARLCRLLDDAGVEYVVAASGPAGGRHVWSAWPQGLDAGEVRRLAEGLQVLAPALDPGCLQNPATGCVRPVGAPHRHGGRAQLHADQQPQRAAAVLQAGNPSGRWQALLAVLPAELRDRVTGVPAAAASPGVRAAADGPVSDVDVDEQLVDDELAGRRARLVVDGGRRRLAGVRRGLSAGTVALLSGRAPATVDASAVLWQCLLRLVFARHSFADALALLDDPAVHGFAHLRSAPAGPGGGRVLRSAATARAMLARQWDRAVDQAVVLYRGVPAGVDVGLAELVGRVQAAADRVDPARWGEQAGPADRAVLDAVCLLVLTHNANPVGASVRVVADRVGMGASTAHRVLARLSRPDSTGRTWLAAADLAEGTHAATWRLLDPAAGPDSDSDIAGSDGGCTGGTQGNPPPAGGGYLGSDLAAELRIRLDHQRSDVWTPRGGLGHHTARTHAAVLAGARTLLEVTWVTGYSVRTVWRHLRALVALRLVEVDGSTVTATERPLVEAARELGVDGRGVARRLRHTVEREVLAWWTAEQAWRATRGKAERASRRRARRGPPTPTAAQAVLPVAVDARHTYGRFPVHAGGPKRRRADFAAAAAVVHAHLTRHPSAQAARMTGAAA